MFDFIHFGMQLNNFTKKISKNCRGAFFLIQVTIGIFFFPHRFKPNEGVIIIGATNFPEALDKYVCLHVLLQLLN